MAGQIRGQGSHGRPVRDELAEVTIEQAPDAVFWVDAGANIVRVNEAACRMHGYGRQDFRRLTVFDLTGEYDQAGWSMLWERLRDSGSVRMESHHVRADGSIFPIEAAIFYVRVEEKEFCAAFIRDISERRAAEEDLRKAHEDIRKLKNRLAAENVYLRQEIDQAGLGSAGVVTDDPGFQQVLALAERVAPTDSTVLIQGETGTGKELVARLIHDQSARRDRALVKLNCAAIPPELIESELFGHEKGAFSGAVSRRVGRFEVADGGTLFLDEIGELPSGLQGKLLRVLQEGTFERVGGNETLRTHVRIVAATNRVLQKEVEAGRFRSDLFYRLNVFPLALPALRERPRDMELLVRHFIKKHGPRTKSPAREVSSDVLKRMTEYSWPGNVRELENAVERALILSRGRWLDESVVPVRSGPNEGGSRGGEAPPSPGVPVSAEGPVSMEALEKQALREALEACGRVIGGPKGVAARLKMPPSTVRDRIRKYGL